MRVEDQRLKQSCLNISFYAVGDSDAIDEESQVWFLATPSLFILARHTTQELGRGEVPYFLCHYVCTYI